MPDNTAGPAVSMGSRALGNPWAGFILALVVIVLDSTRKCGLAMSWSIGCLLK